MARSSKPQRLDPLFKKDMEEIAKIRVGKGLAKLRKEEISTREMTNLLRRTQGYQISLKELKVKPKLRR